MSARELITEHLDLWTRAVTKKSTSGRGSNGKIELTGVKKLRELILGMAVQGKLTTREASDEPASDLLQRVSARQTQLYTQGKIKRRKKLPSVSVEEQYFHLPENWEWTRLGALFDSIMSGGTPSKQNSRFWNGDIPWASVKDLGKTKHLDETQDYITKEGLKAGSKLADTGDVLICTRMGLGKIAICSKPIAINQDLKAVKVSPEVSLDYFFLAYTTLDITGTGTTVAGITQDKLLSYVIGLPPIEEQHRIVQKVDELMALCDRLEQQTSNQLEAHETLVDTLLGTLTQSENATELADNWARLAAHFDTLFTTEQSIDKLKQTILQLAVMGRLVEQDAGDELATNLLTQIHTRKMALAGEKRIKRPRPLTQLDETQHSYPAPANWVWASFEDIADEISTGPFGSMIHKHDYVENGTPLVNPSHMVSGGIKEDSSVSVTPAKAEELSSYKLAKGDIVMARRGEVGRCAIVTDRESGWLCGTGSFVLRFHSAINRRFILLLFSTDTVRDYLTGNSVGTTMTNLNHGILKKMPVALPSTEEQYRIVQKVDELMALCDQLKERLNRASETRCQLAAAVVEGAVKR